VLAYTAALIVLEMALRVLYRSTRLVVQRRRARSDEAQDQAANGVAADGIGEGD
jgi:hypothetical protein